MVDQKPAGELAPPEVRDEFPDESVDSAVYTESFDEEFDVVVAGYGFAGGIAAIEASDPGADVLLLEKEDVPGGISITAGGGIRCTRDADEARKYLEATNGGRVPGDVLEALAEGMSEMEEYIRELAQVNDANVVVHKGPDKRGNYPFSGGKSLYFVGIESIPGLDISEEFSHVSGRGGARMFKVIDDHIAQRDVEVRLETPVKRLITDERRSEVRGVVAGSNGSERSIKARRGVILACGGFESNEWMKKQYFENKPVLPVVANNTGDGIRMAMDLGADLWHMWHFHGGYGFEHPNPDCPYAIRCKRLPDWVPDEAAVFVPSMGRQSELEHDPHYVEDMDDASVDAKGVPMTWILLDQSGDRFMNEYPPYLQDTAHRPMGVFDPHAQGFPRNPAYLICDDEGRKRYPLGDPVRNSSDPDHVYEWSADNTKEVENGILERADTISGLAEQLGLDPATTQQSVDRWNELCRNDEDEDFGRPPGSMMPVESPPFYGAEVQPTVSNTQGGPVRNGRQQILSVSGDPISRLYGAGQMCSPFGHLYMSGGNLSDCFIGGWTAAREVTRLEPWE